MILGPEDPSPDDIGLTEDLDAAIFAAEWDLGHDQAAPETRRELARMRAERDRLVRAWEARITAADYADDKLEELDGAPDAATAAAAVGRWNLLGSAPQPPPPALPTTEPPRQARAVSRSELHAAVTRHVAQFFARAEASEGRPPRVLLQAETGSAKTGIALAHLCTMIGSRKAAGRPYRAVMAVPAHRLGRELVDRAQALGINAALFQGRGNPGKPDQPCRNLEAVGLARQAGADIRGTVCGPTAGGARCGFHAGCVSDGYFAGLARAKAADLMIVAHNFIFDPLPKELRRDLGFVLIDEDFAALADNIADLTLDTLAPESLARFPVLDAETQEIDEAATESLRRLHEQVYQAARGHAGYLTADALRGTGFTAVSDAPVRMRALNWRRKREAQMRPGMDLEARQAAARLVAVNSQLVRISALTHALEGMLTRGQAGAGLVSVRLDMRRDGSQTVLTVRGQRQPANWLADLPVLVLNATGWLDDVRRVFPDAELAEAPRGAAPHCRVHQILGGFGRSTLARHPSRLAELRDFITVATLGLPSALVVTHKPTENTFAGMLGLATAHHGAIAGSDEHAAVDAAFVIGGAFASPGDVASIAAARGGGAVATAKPERVSRAALLSNGSAVAIECFGFADPATDAVHRGIYDASIIQAAGRVRPLQRTEKNPAVVYVFGNVALPFPVDAISRWRDIKPDRLTRMVAAESVCTNAADMAALHPSLFRSEKAAEHARRRFAGTVADMREATAAIVRHDSRPWVEITYQPAGRGQRRRALFTPAAADGVMRKAIEAVHGALARWRVRPLTAGRGRVPQGPEINYLPGVGESSLVHDLAPIAPIAWPSGDPPIHAIGPPDG